MDIKLTPTRVIVTNSNKGIKQKTPAQNKKCVEVSFCLENRTFTSQQRQAWSAFWSSVIKDVDVENRNTGVTSSGIEGGVGDGTIITST